MSSVNPNAGPPRPTVQLDYGHRDSIPKGWRNLSAAIHERFDGALRFLGMLIGMIGGNRQTIWCFGFAFIGAGLGVSLQQYPSHGPLLLFAGGFMVGMVIPVPKSR